MPNAFSTLVINAKGASVSLSTSGLPAGDVVTIWWVVFNHPEFCAGVSPGHPFRCGLSDLLPSGGDPRIESSAFYATGHVIDETGIAEFGAYTKVGAPSGQVLFGDGLTNPSGADIHFVVHDHGPAIPGMVDFMIHSFGGGCSNLPPMTGPNFCQDLQFSVHEQ